MTTADIRPGVQVFDRTLKRSGMVLALHRYANPNLDSDLVTVNVAPGALIWSRISDLEQA